VPIWCIDYLFSSPSYVTMTKRKSMWETSLARLCPLHLPVLPWLTGLFSWPKVVDLSTSLKDARLTTYRTITAVPFVIYCERVKVWALKSPVRLTLAESGHNKAKQHTREPAPSELWDMLWRSGQNLAWPTLSFSALCSTQHFACATQFRLLSDWWLDWMF